MRLTTAVVLVLAAITAGVPLRAQPSTTTLTYVSSSTAKIEQVIGDCDWQAQAQEIFINVEMHAFGSTVVMFGAEPCRASDIAANGHTASAPRAMEP